MLQSSRGPEMERTKFMQVMIEGASGLFQNLSSVATEMGKQAGWSWEGSNEPPVVEQHEMSDPFAVNFMGK